MLQVKLLQ